MSFPSLNLPMSIISHLDEWVLYRKLGDAVNLISWGNIISDFVWIRMSTSYPVGANADRTNSYKSSTNLTKHDIFMNKRVLQQQHLFRCWPHQLSWQFVAILRFGKLNSFVCFCMIMSRRWLGLGMDLHDWFFWHGQLFLRNVFVHLNGSVLKHSFR